MSYRDAAGFFCTADKLLELILKDGLMDFKECAEFLILFVKDAYGAIHLTLNQELFMALSLPYDDRTKQIIEFGKENNIPLEAWLEAIENRARNG